MTRARRTGVLACVVVLILTIISPAFAETLGLISDEFNSVAYDGNDGSIRWGGDWHEKPLSSGPDRGMVQVVTGSDCEDTACLRIGAGNVSGQGIHREVNLTDAVSATLTFDSKRQVEEGSNGRVVIAISLDGWSWVPVGQLHLDASDEALVANRIDLSAWAGQDVRVGLLGNGRIDGYLYIDNVEVALSDNHRPEFVTPISSRGNTEGDSVSIAPLANDSDDSALRFSAIGLPDGLEVDEETGTISGTIAFSAASRSPYSTVLTVADPEGATASEAFVWAVADNNRPPIIEPIEDRTVDESAPMAVQVGASDPDLPDDDLIFSLSQSPAGAAITDAGLVTWTPDENDGPGNYTFVVTVADTGSPPATTSQSFDVLVREVNRAPRISPITDLALRPGDEVFVVIEWSDSDIPINAVIFSAEGLPPGVSIAPATGRLTGTIDSASPDMSGVATVAATDDGSPSARSVQTFSWQIGSGNSPPVLDPIPEQTLAEDGSVTFVAAASDSDPGDTVSFWLTDGIDPVPDGASIDEDSGLFAWTPTEEQHNATYRINVGVSDSGAPRLSDTQLVTIIVPEFNEAPSLESISDQTSAEGEPVSLEISADDPNSGDNLRYLAIGLPETLEIDETTGEITGEIGFDAASDSPHSVTVTVEDDGVPSRSDVARFTWTVTETNRPPTAPLLSVIALIGEQVEIELPAIDPDGDDLTYEISDPPVMGDLAGEPPYLVYTAVSGESDGFSYLVSDGEFEAEGVVTIELRVGNSPPMAANDEYSTDVDVDLVVAAPGLLTNDTDEDGEALEAKLVAPPDHGELQLEPTGAFTYVPEAGYEGADKFTYAAVDGFGEESTATVVINVAGPSTTPVGEGEPEDPAAAAFAGRSWQPAPEDDLSLFATARRGVVRSVRSLLGMIAEVRYPLALLAAALLLALTFGRVSLTPLGGRKQEEGHVESFDTTKLTGWLTPHDGGEVYVHAGSLDGSIALVPGQRVEFIAAMIRGRRVALKVWPAT